MANLIYNNWALGQAIYNAQTAEGATGTAEDSVNALTGCIRLAATDSTTTLALTGTNGTVIAADSIAAVTGSNGNQFALNAAATLATATSWAGTTSYTLGQYVTNASNIYYCTASGVSASSGGPTGTGSSIPDGSGSLVWAYVGAGTAMAVAAATATVTGPLAGPSGTITVIVTPVSGWSNVWNPLDAALGTNEETDSAYRIRRNAELGENGKGYLNAIRAAVLEVDADTPNAVTACTVFENYTDETSGDGIPPHAIECLVEGGLNLDVATAIFNTIPAGIQPFGQTNTVTETITDSAGNTHVVQFSRPEAVNIYVTLNVTVNPESPYFNTSDGGQAAIQAQVVSWGNGLGAGFDVSASYASAQAFIANVGAWAVTSAYVGTAPSPASGEVVITARELPNFDTAWVVVNITQAAP
jgi:uncharacterized phage protein gp47/JayE